MYKNEDLKIAYIFSNRGKYINSEGKEVSLFTIKNSKYEIIRTNGTSFCYPLIDTVGGDSVIQVCSPYLWNPRNLIRSFSKIKTLQLSPSVGGFHSVTKEDYELYKMRFYIDIRVDNDSDSYIVHNRLSDSIVESLKNTNIYKRLKFCSHLNEEKLARLLLIICDPRWHTSVDGSHKLHLLFNTTKYRYKTRKVYDQKFALVLNTWQQNVAVWLNKLTEEKNLNLTPHEFLLQEWLKLTELTKNKEFSDLKTTERFLDYIYYTWQDYLHMHIGDSVFDLDKVFSDEVHKREWILWRNTVSKL